MCKECKSYTDVSNEQEKSMKDNDDEVGEIILAIFFAVYILNTLIIGVTLCGLFF